MRIGVSLEHTKVGQKYHRVTKIELSEGCGFDSCLGRTSFVYQSRSIRPPQRTTGTRPLTDSPLCSRRRKITDSSSNSILFCSFVTAFINRAVELFGVAVEGARDGVRQEVSFIDAWRAMRRRVVEEG